MSRPKPSDRWFLLIWTCFALAIVLSRKLFIGDGVRHVVYVFGHSVPDIGEARWLLFPPFIFSMLRPLYVLGIVHTTHGALVAFALASVAFSVLFLGALRAWLIQQQVETSRRWIALATAAVCPSFLMMATDTAEPIFAGALATAGLAVIARTQRLPVGVLLMSLGMLLHQTVFVAFFLLPLATPWRTLGDPRQLGRTALIVAAVITLTFGILMAANHVSLADALGRVLLVYRNPIHMNWMRGGLLKGVAVTVFGGFPQALVTIPGMNGMRGIISGSRHGDPRAVGQALRLGLGFGLVVSGAVFAYRRRRWEWLVALAGFSILPIVWNNLYGYYKFYLLFPLLAAHVIARVSPRVSLPIVAILSVLNVGALVDGVRIGRAKSVARGIQYTRARGETRWITSAWEPDLPYLWPGRSCGMLRSLGKSTTARTEEEVRRERTGEFIDCMREAFCSGQPVWTDDWVTQNAPAIREIATYHGLSTAFLDRTWWRGAADGEAVDGDPRHPLYVFSQERQLQICNDLREHPTD